MVGIKNRSGGRRVGAGAKPGTSGGKQPGAGRPLKNFTIQEGQTIVVEDGISTRFVETNIIDKDTVCLVYESGKIFISKSIEQ